MSELELDYDELAKKIAEQLARQARASDIMWNSAECADYLRISRRHFMGRIKTLASFPRSCATGGLWLRSEVVRWARANH
jgi:predicted DNA-binding transcriptional regulator AlpA